MIELPFPWQCHAPRGSATSVPWGFPAADEWVYLAILDRYNVNTCMYRHTTIYCIEYTYTHYSIWTAWILYFLILDVVYYCATKARWIISKTSHDRIWSSSSSTKRARTSYSHLKVPSPATSNPEDMACLEIWLAGRLGAPWCSVPLVSWGGNHWDTNFVEDTITMACA